MQPDISPDGYGLSNKDAQAFLYALPALLAKISRSSKRILWLSPGWESLAEWNRRRYYGSTIYEIIHVDDRDLAEDHLEKGDYETLLCRFSLDGQHATPLIWSTFTDGEIIYMTAINVSGLSNELVQLRQYVDLVESHFKRKNGSITSRIRSVSDHMERLEQEIERRACTFSRQSAA